MKFDKTDVWGFEHALRGMRNPMASWERSDSVFTEGCPYGNTDVLCDKCKCFQGYDKPCAPLIGDNDMHLAQTLISAGAEHRKYMRQIFVSVDITAPLYWWKEFDTYKVGTTANSTSTMHKLSETKITKDCFETDDYHGDLNLGDGQTMENALDPIINTLEALRLEYIRTGDKKYWKELIRWLPESWLQTRTVTMNYENVYSMVHQRKNHKLNEWSGRDDDTLTNFISWAKTLPYAGELIFADLSE